MASASVRVQRYKALLCKAEENDKRIATLVATVEKLKAEKSASPTKPVAQVVQIPAAPAAEKKSGSYCIFFDKHTSKAIVALLAMNPLSKETLKVCQKSDVAQILDKVTKTTISGEDSALKFLGRLTGYTPVDDEFTAIQSESWVTRAYAMYQDGTYLEDLNEALTLRTFIVGRKFTTGDLALWSVLSSNQAFLSARGNFTYLNRYFSFLDRRYSKLVTPVEKKDCSKGKNDGGKKKDKDGKKGNKKAAASKADGAAVLNFGPEWKGKVVTRFPPEPSGYLHIGHAKAMLHNYHTAVENEGKMLVRFDDTNPSKEKAEYETTILEDINKLGVKYASLSYTSDYLQIIQDICENALKDGLFYVDTRPQEDIKKERENFESSPLRDTSPEVNLELWEEMKKGVEGMVVRAKLVPDSCNGTLRDPSMYRVNLDSHHRTKDQFKVYPTYDLACPIVDSLEGVTHAMRSNEYNERDIQYGLIWDLVCSDYEYNGKKLTKPIIKQFSRLEFVHTVLSKRKLGAIVEKGIVDSWEDPRMPTIRGILRRGMTVQGLKDYIATQGGSIRGNTQHWDVIWAKNKQVINPNAGRYWAITNENAVPLSLTAGAPDEGFKSVPWNPTNKELKRNKSLQISKNVYVEQASCDGMKEGDIVNLNQWGNMKVTKMEKDGDVVKSMEGEFLPQNKNFKKIHRLNWVANCGDAIPICKVELDFLFTCEVLDKDADFWDFVNTESKFETMMIGEQALRECRKGDHIQLMRLGYFIVDQPYINDETPMILISVPDGKATEQSALAAKANKVAAKNK